MNYAFMLGGIFVVHVLAMISPGPNVLIVTQTAMSRTRRAEVATALGIVVGAALWSGAVLLGMSVLFAHFAWVYSELKFLGGGYLLYLGIKLWRAAALPIVAATGQPTAQTDSQAFWLGLLTNMTNPKAVIFYGNIFVAFVAPDLPVWVKLAAGSLIFVNSAVRHVALVCLFSTLRAQQVYRRIKRWIDRMVGAALAFLGLWLIIQSWWTAGGNA